MEYLFMMTSSNGNIFRVTGSFVRGIHRSPVNSQHKGQWRGALMFSLICAWINGWVNNREAGGLRRNRAHYHVIVMCEDFGEYWPHYNSTALWKSCLHLCLLISRIAEEGHQLRGHNDRQCLIFWERTINILMVYLHWLVSCFYHKHWV